MTRAESKKFGPAKLTAAEWEQMDAAVEDSKQFSKAVQKQ